MGTFRSLKRADEVARERGADVSANIDYLARA
jgi:hypothetical protein